MQSRAHLRGLAHTVVLADEQVAHGLRAVLQSSLCVSHLPAPAHAHVRHPGPDVRKPRLPYSTPRLSHLAWHNPSLLQLPGVRTIRHVQAALSQGEPS